MKNAAKLFNIILVTLILSIGTVCIIATGGGGDGGSNGVTDTDGTDTEKPGDLPVLAETMILILDSEGNPVKNALVEDVYLSDSNGVVLGDQAQLDSGWMAISALGYAQGFTRPQSTYFETNLAVATLSPFQTSVLHDGSSDSQLINGDPEQPDIEVMLDEDLFTVDDILVRLAEIEPLTIGPLFAPLDSGTDLNLQAAFVLRAYDVMGNQAIFNEGKVVNITFRDEGSLTDAAQLAYFDVTSGLWQVIPNSLSRFDADHIQCMLPHFSTFGIFDDRQPIYLDSDPETPDSWFEAWARLNYIFIAADRNKTIPEKAVVDKAMEDLAKAAKDWAKTHRNESGKNLLMQAIDKAKFTGSDKVVEELKQEAQTLTKELGEKLLKDPGCGKIGELLALSTQAQLLGGLESLQSQLYQKHKDLRKICAVWNGTIEYTIHLDTPYPWPDYEEWEYESGARSWTEKHEVLIAVHENGLLDGECFVENKMPTTRYRKDRNTGCGLAWTDLAVKTFPSKGHCRLGFEGTYDNDTFIIGPVGIMKSQFIENKPIVMNFNTEIHEYFGEECQVYERDQGWKFADYYSQLIHGFLAAPQPPTIEEMLNTGERRVIDKGELPRETIKGFTVINYSVGENINPVLPISHAWVSWSFTKYGIKPEISP